VTNEDLRSELVALMGSVCRETGEEQLVSDTLPFDMRYPRIILSSMSFSCGRPGD
jgi:hypothetical protein